MYILDTFFCQIKSFIRFHLAFGFGLQTYYLIDFIRIYQLKGLEPKKKAKQNLINDLIWRKIMFDINTDSHWGACIITW